MSAPKDELLQAVELALVGKWDAAHQLVQPYEDDMTAAWIHAVLHKVEGDLGNARYWYRRADRMDHVADEPRAELTAIRVELTADGHDVLFNQLSDLKSSFTIDTQRNNL
jgi:hypothetical protein